MREVDANVMWIDNNKLDNIENSMMWLNYILEDNDAVNKLSDFIQKRQVKK